MIKRFAALATSVALTATAASAGGPVTPVMEAEPVAVAVALPAAAPSWTGGYLGGNLSFGDGKVTAEGFDSALAKPDGASAAIRGGYDWQFGQFVLGLGAEYNVGKYKSGLNSALSSPDATGTVEMKNAATVYGRVGYAVNDQFLAYGTIGHTRAKGNVFVNGVEPPISDSTTLKGTTFGLGGEYRFTPRVSAYAEYNHTDFGSVPEFDFKPEAKLGQIKLGANFRF